MLRYTQGSRRSNKKPRRETRRGPENGVNAAMSGCMKYQIQETVHRRERRIVARIIARKQHMAFGRLRLHRGGELVGVHNVCFTVLFEINPVGERQAIGGRIHPGDKCARSRFERPQNPYSRYTVRRFRETPDLRDDTARLSSGVLNCLVYRADDIRAFPVYLHGAQERAQHLRMILNDLVAQIRPASLARHRTATAGPGTGQPGDEILPDDRTVRQHYGRYVLVGKIVDIWQRVRDTRRQGPKYRAYYSHSLAPLFGIRGLDTPGRHPGISPHDEVQGWRTAAR